MDLANAFTGLEPGQICWDMILLNVRLAEVTDVFFSKDLDAGLLFIFSADASMSGNLGLGSLVVSWFVERDITPRGSTVIGTSKVK